MSHRQVLEALSGLLLGMFVSMISSTVVSSSMPIIVHDIHGSQSDYTWVITATLLATTVVVLVVAFANIFTVIQPVIEANDWNSALWMVGGPIFFSLMAMGIYENYRRRVAQSTIWVAD